MAKERAESSGLREELETVTLKAQSIAVDAVLSARAKLMEEYKKGEHASWDLDQEIETWKKREIVLAVGEDTSDEGAAPAMRSPKPVEIGVDPK